MMNEATPVGNRVRPHRNQRELPGRRRQLFRGGAGERLRVIRRQKEMHA
jgi:hypothetical protein